MVAQMQAEVSITEAVRPSSRRVPPEELEAALATNPVGVVLDALDLRADAGLKVSYDWVAQPHKELDGDPPTKAVDEGRVQLVLSLIEMDFPLPDRP